jgi:hypothetical protein
VQTEGIESIFNKIIGEIFPDFEKKIAIQVF